MLDGIRIVEFEALGPAPFAGTMLAELGAEVIIIHRADGVQSPGRTAESPLDRGKKSIVLDLKKPEGHEIARQIIGCSDGLIEGFRPGVMERLGLGPDVVKREHEELVYGRMTGWGQEGPRAQQAGHDLNYAALSGALWYASKAGDVPQIPPTLVGDIGGGALYLVIGMLTGLLRARETGQGCVVDAAIVDGTAHMMNLLMTFQSHQRLSETRGRSLLDGPHWSRCYECSDGAYISVQCLEPKFYALFLDRLGLSESPHFQAQYDPQQWADQSVALSALFAARAQSHWTRLFEGTDACVTPVYSPWQSQHDPHILARGVWREVDGMLSAAPAPRFDGVAPSVLPPCVRDANRGEVLALINSSV